LPIVIVTLVVGPTDTVTVPEDAEPLVLELELALVPELVPEPVVVTLVVLRDGAAGRPEGADGASAQAAASAQPAIVPPARRRRGNERERSE
jgi:hypothetical protein